jgi:iron complex transport system substrate-binding protein
VITLEPHTLEEVFDSILVVGQALGRTAEAAALVKALRSRVAAVRARAVRRRHRPRVAFLEWADPLISGGHWNPQLVELAGGRDGLGRPGRRSRTLAWEEILAWRPEVMVLACCGFDEARGLEELDLLRRRPGFSDLPCAGAGRVHVMDGVRLFSRPGPSLVDSLERLAAVLGD